MRTLAGWTASRIKTQGFVESVTVGTGSEGASGSTPFGSSIFFGGISTAVCGAEAGASLGCSCSFTEVAGFVEGVVALASADFGSTVSDGFLGAKFARSVGLEASIGIVGSVFGGAPVGVAMAGTNVGRTSVFAGTWTIGTVAEDCVGFAVVAVGSPVAGATGR